MEGILDAEAPTSESSFSQPAVVHIEPPVYLIFLSFVLVASHISVSLLMLSDIIYSRPYRSRSQNHWEIFNELTVLGVAYCLFGFTDWIDDNDVRFTIGWV